VKRVLIVSPHFPPVNAADMHRVRMSLPYFAEYGWSPLVLTVRPEDQEAPIEPELMALVPQDVPVVRTPALPIRLTKLVGVRNVGIRAFVHLYRAGARLIREHHVDLVYFSTTMFVTMALGRIWKRRFGVPYVIDMQDPWLSTYYDDKPASEAPPKYGLARRLHAVLEPWTMREVGGIVSVSASYIETLRERYPWIAAGACATIPFGASERDFDVAGRMVRTRETTAGGDRLRGVYIGRGGPDMATALTILFRALRDGARSHSMLSRVALSFVGTDYAPAGRARKSVDPVAIAEGVAAQVSEQTTRIGYLDALVALKQADFLVLIGSDDPDYRASKVHPYILAGRPIVAVVHERSPVADLIRKTGTGLVVTFAGRGDTEGPAARLMSAWPGLLERLPFMPPMDRVAIAPYSARELTRQQCRLFDTVLQPECAVAVTPCLG
jgi:hypothetical protein